MSESKYVSKYVRLYGFNLHELAEKLLSNETEIFRFIRDNDDKTIAKRFKAIQVFKNKN
jgi:hypothetical protein